MRGRKKRLMPEPDKPFNVNELGQDVEDALRGENPHDLDHESMQQIEIYAPPSVRVAHHTQVPSLPEFADDYVAPPQQQTAAAYQAGETSEAAIAIQFEAVAKEVEAMGAVMKQTAKQAELMMHDVTAALQYVGEIAEKYRSGGKVLYSRLEQVSAMAEAVKVTCEQLKQNIQQDV